MYVRTHTLIDIEVFNCSSFSLPVLISRRIPQEIFPLFFNLLCPFLLQWSTPPQCEKKKSVDGRTQKRKNQLTFLKVLFSDLLVFGSLARSCDSILASESPLKNMWMSAPKNESVGRSGQPKGMPMTKRRKPITFFMCIQKLTTVGQDRAS